MAEPTYNQFLDAWRAASEAERPAIEERYAAWRTTQRPDETAWNAGLRRAGLPSSMAVGALIRPMTNPTWGLGRILGGLNETPNSRAAAQERNAALARPAAAPTPPDVGDVFGLNLERAGGGERQGPQDTFNRMLGITAQAESGNRERDARGNLITSSAGAQGSMQVMPRTNTDPGFGVRPAADTSDAERARVGQDYLNAMLARYGNDPSKAWAAYNWGPGNLDRAIAQHGENWLQAAPDETKNYVASNVRQLRGAAGSTVDAGRAIGQGIFASIDPRTAMGYIPDPQRLTAPTLPNAPQRALPQDLPQYEVPDADILLAGLRAAAQVPERDNSNDAWERVQSLLQGAASGMSGGDGLGFGNLLARGGAGASAGFTGERERQRGLDAEQDAQARQMQILLAQAGIDVNMQSLAGRNQNLDRGWQSTENQNDTRFSNDTNTFNRNLAQTNLNYGTDQFNVQNTNQANLVRGQVGLGALEGQVNAQNQGTQLGIQLAQAAATPDPRQADVRIGQAIRDAGFVENDTTIAVGRALAARNSSAVLPYISQEMVQSGLYSSMLNEADVKKVDQYIQQEQPEQALAIVQQALGAVAQSPEGRTIMDSIVNDLADQGLPASSMVRAARAGQ